MSETLSLPLEPEKPKSGKPAKKRTEAELLRLLRERHVRPGNGGAGEYAFMTHVRNAAGFDADRTFDAVAMGLWPSRGLQLHVYEVKCSRSDWLRELKNPAKAEAAARACDRFSMVVADDSIIADGELPTPWGLLVAHGNKLVCVKPAPLLPEADPKRPVGRSFLVSLLRAGGAVPVADSAEVQAARAEGFAKGVQTGQDTVAAAEALAADLRQKIQAFETASGLEFMGWRGHDPAELGRAVRSILDGEGRADQARQQILNVQTNLRRAADELDRFLPKGT